MSIANITGAVQGALARGGQGLFVEADASFRQTLTIGQILKAKVLRHYEGSRYLVDFTGQQKVVDSAIPLRVGDTVHGRVVALGEQVHLQRVAADGSAETADPNPKPAKPNAFNAGFNEQLLDQTFVRYQGRLNAEQRAELLKLSARAARPDLMMLSGLVLSKLGMRMTPDFLRAIYRVLENNRPAQTILDRPALNADRRADQRDSADTIKQLAGLLENKQIDEWRQNASPPADGNSETVADTTSQTGSGDTGAGDRRERGQSEWQLGQWLLNTQSEGAVGHRLAVLPLWFGDRLSEVNVALFSQREDTRQSDGIRYRRVVLSLDVGQLGHLDITARIADRRLHLSIAADNSAATEVLAAYLGDLKADLTVHDWQLDEIEYVTSTAKNDDRALRSVVEHYITQDSLSRLM